MKTNLLVSLLMIGTVSTVAAYPQIKALAANVSAAFPYNNPLTIAANPLSIDPLTIDPANQTPGSISLERPQVEVVFVLDTTSSMSGMIQAAKENIWSIASTLASAQPAPELKMGLVAFRDKGDRYVTQITDLGTDLDSMYAKLMDYQAEGGGDGPEHVNQALFDAVNGVSWSQKEGVYRVIFLVGDAPAHMDYQDDVKYPETIKTAISRGIVVNTVLAGSDESTASQWQQIASLNQGEYFQVAQDGNAVAVTTPFDEKIAALSAELDATRVFYGDESKRKALADKSEATEKLHSEGSLASRAKRAIYNASVAGKENFTADSDLIDDISSGKVRLEAIAPAALPASVQGLSDAEQLAMIQAKASERQKLNEAINELSVKRQQYIKEELSAKGASESTLDYQIFNAIKAQGEGKGLAYEEIAY